jgi:CBS domain-containing protein/ribosome-associated translation inhibitor RaiA
MRIRELMRTPVVTIEATSAVNDAWSLMKDRGIRHLVVTEGAELIGVLSERDFERRPGGGLPHDQSVEEVMTPGVVTTRPSSTLRQAANLMWGRRVGSLPVLERDRLVGIVTATDVLEVLGRGSSRPTIRAERHTLRLPANSKRLGGRPVVRRRSRSAAKKGRGRRRKADSKKRAPFAAVVAKALKTESGGFGPPSIPAHIRSAGVDLGQDDRTYIRRKLGMKLGKFASSIERITVRVSDVNGPRGGRDQVCRVKVVLSGLPSTVVEQRDASLHAAIDLALAGAERAVRKALKRRATTATKPTTPRFPVPAAQNAGAP